MRKMNKGIFITRVPPILEFANQQEAAKRIRGITAISFILVVICTTFNIQTFMILYPYTRIENMQFGYWFIATTIIPVVLFFTAMIVYILPIIPRNKEKDNEELLNRRDYIKIAKELFNPTTRGYRINRIIRFASIFAGLLIFIANFILIFVGMFLFIIF